MRTINFPGLVDPAIGGKIGLYGTAVKNATFVVAIIRNGNAFASNPLLMRCYSSEAFRSRGKPHTFS